MDEIRPLGSNIAEHVQPTFRAYTKLQLPRKTEIFSNPPTEHQYGPHARQKLDVFLPPSAFSSGSGLPCIIFLYGGGLSRGDRRFPPSEGTIFANVGHYFSQRGFVTVLPDYRLYGSHDAFYPSGGEDVGLALKWTLENVPSVDRNRVFLMGTSAGAVHISTYLWAPELVETRPTPDVRGAILLQAPFHFQDASEERSSVLDGYYGGEKASRCPYALRQKSDDRTECVVALAELDPEDEILSPNRDFLALFPINGVEKPHQLPEIKGHNHISPVLALGLGGREDAWAEDLLAWINSRK